MVWCTYFSEDFWDAYRLLIPRDPGFEERGLLYELYRRLNHYNLFSGRGYLNGLNMAKRDLDLLKDALDSMERSSIYPSGCNMELPAPQRDLW